MAPTPAWRLTATPSSPCNTTPKPPPARRTATTCSPGLWAKWKKPRADPEIMQSKINLAEKLSTFSDYFSPRTIAQYNECDVMVVKAKGQFVWHKHDDTDDFFLVLKGSLDI